MAAIVPQRVHRMLDVVAVDRIDRPAGQRRQQRQVIGFGEPPVRFPVHRRRHLLQQRPAPGRFQTVEKRAARRRQPKHLSQQLQVLAAAARGREHALNVDPQPLFVRRRRALPRMLAVARQRRAHRLEKAVGHQRVSQVRFCLFHPDNQQISPVAIHSIAFILQDIIGYRLPIKKS